MSFGVSLGLIFSGRQTRRYLYAAILLLVCVSIIMANSRAGIISMLGQVGFGAWVTLSRLIGGRAWPDARDQHGGEQSLWHKTRLLALRCVLIVFFLGATSGIVFWLGGEPVRQRLETVPGEFVTRTENYETGSPRRMEIWAATWRLIKDHPIVGSGFGAYDTAITKFFRATTDWRPQQAHNDYLELAAGGGLIGIVLAIWLLFILIRNARRCLQKNDTFRHAMCIGALIGLVGVGIHSLVDYGLHVPVNAFMCCVLFALATADTEFAKG